MTPQIEEKLKAIMDALINPACGENFKSMKGCAGMGWNCCYTCEVPINNNERQQNER